MLLSDDVPLRTSEVIDAYREAALLPWGYGDCSRSPQAVVRLSDTRFLVLDHPCKAVTGAQIDGQESQGWQASAFTDATGHTSTVIDFASAVPLGAEVTATWLGMQDARTGALIENPGDVIESILRRSGFDIAPSMLDGLYRLRADAAAEGLTIGGRIGAAVSLRAVLNGIVRSIGGGWSSESFWLHPAAQVGSAPTADDEGRLPYAVVGEVTAHYETSFSTLRVKFDDQAYRAEHRQSLTLRARPSLSTREEPVELLAPWLRNFASATAVAVRVLRRASGQQFEVRVEAPAVSPGVKIGDVFALASPMFPVPGRQWLTVIDRAQLAERVQLTCDMVLPLAGQVCDVVASTVAGAVTQLAAVEVAFSNGTATFTVTDDNGKPLVAARVSLDGATPKRTDASGRVSFQAARGVHKLYIEAAGFQPFEMTVTI